MFAHVRIGTCFETGSHHVAQVGLKFTTKPRLALPSWQSFGLNPQVLGYEHEAARLGINQLHL